MIQPKAIHLHRHILHLPPRKPIQHILSELQIRTSLPRFNQLHALFITSGLFRGALPATRLLKCATDASNHPLAQLIFAQIQSPDAFSYNALIKALALSPHPLISLCFYRGMLRRGLSPNEYTFCFLLDCCARGLALLEGRQVHAHVGKRGLAAALFAGTSLVHMYGDCGAPADARRAFDEMPQRSGVSWAAVVDACVGCGEPAGALRLFREMRGAGVQPNNAALVGALCACAEIGDSAAGRAVHAHVVVRGLELNVTLGTSLVDMYSKSGAIDSATAVFLLMPVTSVASWNCLIHGTAINGQGDKAVSLFEKMKHKTDVRPNKVTFLSVLHACSHSGLVEEGVKFFAEMSSRMYNIVPSIEHYGCMVDLYARSGRLDDAMGLVKAMPMKPDIGIWGSLIVSCRNHGYRDMETPLAAQILKLAPDDTCGYLFLADAFAKERRWEDVIGVRKMMREMDVRKVAGSSSIAKWF
ncbi:Pentatricopeptide repeat-containing protein [Ananas comosus]|uniref:Pentatricopeptide repeat-containing protein n=1 Tax=Ananas comosus TaxID=4615 RepID=A0A199UL31_ANACO|nr:Pentatricopeptide repeat-containing protein [Ananas comosus]